MSMNLDIPEMFDARFVEWFRSRMEASWATLAPSTPEQVLAEHVEAGAGGCIWQHGTRWSDGLSEEAIARIEHEQQFVFPPDYRLLIQHLHVTTLPMLCAGYLEQSMRLEDQPDVLAAAYLEEYQQYMVLEESEGFHDWRTETSSSLSAQPAALWHSIQFDVEHNDLWRVEWGLRPPLLEARTQRVRELVEAAPGLVRIFGSRYLIAQPCAAGNPVLSIDQVDVVMYAANLRDYLLFEFAELLGPPGSQMEQTVLATVLAHRAEYAAIPFWGSLYTV